jgi:hypothetical protein
VTKTILIYDDEPRRVDEWRQKLRSVPGVKDAFDVEGLNNPNFLTEIRALQERQRRARRRGSSKPATETLLDGVAILVIDYDLLRLELEGYLTGEATAYLARCYSRCGLIVALNQFGENPFDLTLRGYPESYADLNIGSSQLANPGLWADSWSGFRPWSWPLLPKALKSFRQREKELENRLDEPIVKHLGLSNQVVRVLPQTAGDFLAPRKGRHKKDRIGEITFRYFAGASGQGFKGKDEPLNDEDVARVAAARVGHWVECHLLPGQDILVDAPHLANRYPSLLVGDVRKIDTWNRTARLSTAEGVGFKRSPLNESSFPSNWVSRPAWKWDQVSKEESIKDVREPWSIERPDWVFCEDISRFVPVSAALEFAAQIESPFANRYIANHRSKLVGVRLNAELQQVTYTPPERLHL